VRNIFLLRWILDQRKFLDVIKNLSSFNKIRQWALEQKRQGASNRHLNWPTAGSATSNANSSAFHQFPANGSRVTRNAEFQTNNKSSPPHFYSYDQYTNSFSAVPTFLDVEETSTDHSIAGSEEEFSVDSSSVEHHHHPTHHNHDEEDAAMMLCHLNHTDGYNPMRYFWSPRPVREKVLA